MDANRWEEFHKVAAKNPYRRTSMHTKTYQDEMIANMQAETVFHRMLRQESVPKYLAKRMDRSRPEYRDVIRKYQADIL